MTHPTTKIKVWDAPVRVFHWLLVLSFAGAYLSAEREHWRLLHITLGYSMGGLVAFRLLWGLIGSRYARFASFVRGPAAVLAYLRGLWQGRLQRVGRRMVVRIARGRRQRDAAAGGRAPRGCGGG
jgi:cytochrome b